MAVIRQMPARLVAVAPAKPARAAAVGGPRLAPRPDPKAMSAEQLVTQIASYEAASASNSYALGLCLQELSQASRYRDELGFDTFEALLVARKLPSRMTAFKLIRVVSTYSEQEVTKLGGPAKSYAFIRLAKRQGRNADPRRFLAPNAKIAGLAVSALSLRDIERIPDATKISTPERDKAAKKIRAGSAASSAAWALRIACGCMGDRSRTWTSASTRARPSSCSIYSNATGSWKSRRRGPRKGAFTSWPCKGAFTWRRPRYPPRPCSPARRQRAVRPTASRSATAPRHDAPSASSPPARSACRKLFHMEVAWTSRASGRREHR